jgi:peptidoglycan hydrolase-like protein with peptidoglycan-binding domain
MIMRQHLRITACLAALLSTSSWAETGFFIGNGDYQNRPGLRGGAGVGAVAADIASRQLAVVGRTNATAADLAVAIDQFVTAASERADDGVVVLLAGRFVTSGAETGLLPVDADTTVGLADLPITALPLSSVLAVLADRPGRAVLGLATEDGDRMPEVPFLRAGIGDFAIPQGVTVLRGAPHDLAGFASQTLLRSDIDILAMAENRHDLTVTGYAPAGYAFVAGIAAPEAPPAAPAPDESQADRAQQDAAAWDAARQGDSADAYRAYLSAWPQGSYADAARARLDAIAADPVRRAEAAEDALALDREASRDIQRDLTLLDFAPRGIDGIFGPGTRAAITDWQRQNGAPATGYLDRDQITRLDGQAERRAIQLEAEAQARVQALAAEDRAFWDGTGAAGDEAGLRAYLDRYPDGIFSAQATQSLDALRERKRAELAGQDTAAWDRAAQAGTPAAYRDYLSQFPQGAFAGDAQARIDAAAARDDTEARNAAFAAEENAMQMNTFTLRILEQRLDQLGLEPGAVDGTLDADSRKAIRRYQAARDLPETGYINQPTIVRLLADVVVQ